MTMYLIENLPSPIFPECRKIDLLHDMFVRGIDPFWNETNELKLMIDENKDDEGKIFEERKEQPMPSNSINLEELYHLTQMIQNDIWNVTRHRPTGKIRVDRVNEAINTIFLERGIDNYANQLEVFIKSLIIDDGWSPDRFRGYPHLLTMIKETVGLTKMNYLQALTNKARIMIPPNISIKHIEIIEPALSKTANPSDA